MLVCMLALMAFYLYGQISFRVHLQKRAVVSFLVKQFFLKMIFFSCVSIFLSERVSLFFLLIFVLLFVTINIALQFYYLRAQRSVYDRN